MDRITEALKHRGPQERLARHLALRGLRSCVLPAPLFETGICGAELTDAACDTSGPVVIALSGFSR
jgi:hypothetical protein